MRIANAPFPLDFASNASSTWGESDVDKDAVLLGTMQIGTAMYHVQAMQVREDEHGYQVAVDAAFESDLEHVFALCGGGPLDTTKIPDRDGDYVITIYPFEN